MKKKTFGGFLTSLLIVLALTIAFTSCDITVTIGGETTAADVTTAASPDASTSSDDTSAPSDATTADAAGTTKEPEVTTREPEVTTKEPEVTTREPEVTTTPADPALKPPSDPEVLKKALSDLLNTPGANGLLFSEFLTATDACLWQVVAQYNDNSSYTGDMAKLYAENGYTYSEYTGERHISAAALRAAVAKWTSFDLSDFVSYGDRDPYYLKTADLYSVQFGGVETCGVNIISVDYIERLDYYRVIYESDKVFSETWPLKFNSPIKQPSQMLCGIKWYDGRFVIVSNQALWVSDNSSGESVLEFRERLGNALKVRGFNGLLRSIFHDGLVTGQFDSEIPVCRADLWEVVSQFQDPSVNPEILPALYAENGLKYDPDTGVNYITGFNLDDLLIRWTGLTAKEFMETTSKKPDYLATKDIYCAQRGDVPFMPIEVDTIEYLNFCLYRIKFKGDGERSAKHTAFIELQPDGTYYIHGHTYSQGVG